MRFAICLLLVVGGIVLLVRANPLAALSSSSELARPDAPVDDNTFVSVDTFLPPRSQSADGGLAQDVEAVAKPVDAAQSTGEHADRSPAQAPAPAMPDAFFSICGSPGCVGRPVVRADTPSNTTNGLRGQSASYVPPGALSVSAARRVQGKYYPAGSYEYLHGLFQVPFQIPNVLKSKLALPPPVAPGICPLTGQPLSSNTLSSRRPLNVRVDNAPAARPQSGLSQADIIFETPAEGGLTRFTAVYLCTPDDVQVGPIRSARLIDLQLAPMLKAILVHAGASAPVEDLIWSSEVGDAEFDPVLRGSPGFMWESWRPPPHNIYVDTGSLWSLARRSGLVGPVDLQGLSFDSRAPAGASPIRAVRVPYGDVTQVEYVYGDGLYTKLVGGVAHTDLTTGQPLRFANVIVLFARQTVTPIVEDSEGAHSLDFDVQRQGRALLFRDGLMVDARWLREGRNILFHFVDAKGSPLPLKPGSTLVNIVPLAQRVAVAR